MQLRGKCIVVNIYSKFSFTSLIDCVTLSETMNNETDFTIG